MDILVGVCGLSVDVGGERAVWITLNVHIQHVNETILLFLLGDRIYIYFLSISYTNMAQLLQWCNLHQLKDRRGKYFLLHKKFGVLSCHSASKGSVNHFPGKWRPLLSKYQLLVKFQLTGICC